MIQFYSTLNWYYNLYKSFFEASSELLQLQKPLILHFDVNKTIYMADPVNQKTPEHVVKCALAESAQYQAKWEAHLPKMTYYQYIAEHKLASFKDKPGYKQRIKAEIDNFIEELKRRNHPLYAAIKKRYENCLAKLNARQTKIVPSFYNLLDWLKIHNAKYGLQYKILIRTFGEDRNEMMNELSQRANMKMVEAEFDALGTYSQTGFSATNLSQIYDAWLFDENHMGVQDNHRRWINNGQCWRYGKPFPYERFPKRAVSVFFDDNIDSKKASPTNIVAPFDVATNEFVSVDEALNEGSLYCVDPLQIIEDENYYINLVKDAVKKALVRHDPEIQALADAITGKARISI